MKDHQIITIGRQLGSGGREIGIKLSKELGIPVYDKEILEESAKESGFSREIFEKHDEKPTSSFLYALAMGASSFGHTYQKPLLLEVYLAQFETIRKLAQQGSGIFIGRCSDYVLNDMDAIFNIYVHADMATRVKRTSQKHSLSSKQAEEMCIRNDKDRAGYYNYYANHEWGDSRHYDLTINTSKIEIDQAVEVIKFCLK